MLKAFQQTIAEGVFNVCPQSQLPRFADEFNRELVKDGPYAYCSAFWESEIDSERFYISSYQKIAYTTDGTLAMLKPKQEFTLSFNV